MSLYNKNSGYGLLTALSLQSGLKTSGKVFVVGDSSTVDEDRLKAIFGGDPDGKLRYYSTIDAAINAATAGAGHVIAVLEGHAETLDAASDITADVAGITIVGLGHGEDRPVITFDGSDSTPSIVVSAANVAFKNLIFKCNEASQDHMFDVKGDDLLIEDCDFREGSATGLSFITADTADNDSDRLTIRNCRFYAPTAGNMDNAISLSKDFAGVRIVDCEFHGDFDDACISIPAGGNAQVDLEIRGCRATNLQSGQHAIEINSTTSTGRIVDTYVVTDALATSVDAGGLEMFNVLHNDGTDQGGWSPLAAQPDSANNILGADDADNGFASTNVVANENGSVLERLEQIQEAVNVGTGTSLAANKSLVDALGTDGTTVLDTAAGLAGMIGVNDADNAFSSSSVVANVDGSVLERLEALMDPLSGYNPRMGFGVTKVSNLADGAGTDDLFTVTGRVLITSLTGEVTTVVGGAATLKIRDITNSVDLCAATTIDTDAVGTMYALTSISANILNGTGATPVIGSIPNITGAQQVDVAIVGDAQAALTLSQVLDAADTGAVTWRLTYIPLIPGSTVTAAA